MIRRATPADVGPLSRLLAAAGTDNLPVAFDKLTPLVRGEHVFVVDSGAGVLAAAASIAVVERDGARRPELRFLAIDPALAPTGIEHRMAVAILEPSAAYGYLACARAEMAERLAAVRREAAHRLAWLTLLLVALPRMVLGAGHHDAAVVIAVWSAAALVSAARAPRIPRAIVRRRWLARLRAWTDAVLVRIGDLPVAPYGRHMLAHPWATPEAWLTPRELARSEQEPPAAAVREGSDA